MFQFFEKRIARGLPTAGLLGVEQAFAELLDSCYHCWSRRITSRHLTATLREKAWFVESRLYRKKPCIVHPKLFAKHPRKWYLFSLFLSQETSVRVPPRNSLSAISGLWIVMVLLGLGAANRLPAQS